MTEPTQSAAPTLSAAVAGISALTKAPARPAYGMQVLRDGEVVFPVMLDREHRKNL